MLSKITGLTYALATAVNSVFNKQCLVYVAKGSFATADIPATSTELAALYDGTGEFAFLGNLSESGSKIGWKQNSIPIDFGTIPSSTDVTGTLISLMCDEEMLSFIESQIGEHSFLFIPKSGDDSLFVALSGVTISHEGEIPIIGKSETSKITLTLTANVNKVTDAVKFKKLTT
ncbi:MAG: hypothetical protein WC155_08575 [Candidatus Cloacimonadales bacterium]